MSEAAQKTADTQLAVLDLGGTTIHNDGAIEQALAQAVRFASPESISLNEANQRITEVSHLRGAAKIDLLLAAFSGEEAPARRAMDKLDVLLLQAIDDGALEAMPGATEVLAWLRHSGIKICLATGFTPQIRRHLLTYQGWTDLVDLAVSPEDAGRGRPYPDMILTAADKLAIGSMSQVVVVGDTVNDLVAGTRAGAGTVVGVLSGAHTLDMLTAAPHTHLIADISALPEVLMEGRTLLSD